MPTDEQPMTHDPQLTELAQASHPQGRGLKLSNEQGDYFELSYDHGASSFYVAIVRANDEIEDERSALIDFEHAPKIAEFLGEREGAPSSFDTFKQKHGLAAAYVLATLCGGPIIGLAAIGLAVGIVVAAPGFALGLLAAIPHALKRRRANRKLLHAADELIRAADELIRATEEAADEPKPDTVVLSVESPDHAQALASMLDEAHPGDFEHEARPIDPGYRPWR